MPSKVRIVIANELAKMHTGSLMSRRKALLACEESLEFSDRDLDYRVESGYIEFKQTGEWTKAYQELKSELNDREHWSRSKS